MGIATLNGTAQNKRVTRLLNGTLLNSTITIQYNSTSCQKTVPAAKQNCHKTVLLQNSTIVDKVSSEMSF
jgi:hypothetical protein